MRISLLETAHGIVRAGLHAGDFAVDATLGNGHDTLFLADCVGEHGHVYGFDIQRQALSSTLMRLQQHGLEKRVTLLETSHAEMPACIPERFHGRIKAVMFNLGYLPGGDKSLITLSRSTLAAINAACRLPAEVVITVLAYPGHNGGEQEVRELSEYCRNLQRQPQFDVDTILSQRHQEKAPQLFVIRKHSYLL